MTIDLWEFEKAFADRGFKRVAGVDEAGRGPLAGPVVAAAVVLPPGVDLAGVNDSKKLTPRKRERLYDVIQAAALAVGVGSAAPEEIDRINILQASLLAMRRAVERLVVPPDYLLVDGTFEVPTRLPQTALTKGDARSVSVAAASIIAKVTRDRLMLAFDVQYPHYGFAGHKGYPTASHKAAIRLHGACPIHRRTFRGVKEFLPA